MIDVHALLSAVAFLVTFVVTGSLGVLVLLALERRQGLDRLRGLKGDRQTDNLGIVSRVRILVTRAGAVLLPPEGDTRSLLQKRLTRAGLYRPSDLRMYLGVQSVLACALPALTAGLPMLLGVMQPSTALLVAVFAAGAGVLGPSWWLSTRIANRQASLRRAMPDALDMLVLCAEGGVSMTAAMQRVTAEMERTHKTLGTEMNIILREMQMGMTTGEAMKKFAERCDLEEVGNLASVLLQSERFGAGVVKALRIHADTTRQERQQRAEEIAQKAAVKIIFPTLLCIFPAIFIVILGPAAFQIANMVSSMK